MIARIDNKLITDFFPFPSYREHQRETVEKIQEYFGNDIKDVILEMPTGSGKSPIAISAGLWSENAYCLTSQKILQDQYIRDFEEEYGGVSVLKGRGNYECSFMGAPTMCNECYEPARKNCYKQGQCLYQNTKRRTAAATVALMNYSYFLNVTECDPSATFGVRKLLIMDECLPGSALIFIDYNKQVKIEDIYLRHDITHVISFNEEKNIYEKKKILRRFKNKVTAKDIWYKITVNVDDKTFILKLTSNHKVWTKNRGYVQTAELTVNDVIKVDTSSKYTMHCCDICDKTFNNSRSLKIHKGWHKNKIGRIQSQKESIKLRKKDEKTYAEYCKGISSRAKNRHTPMSCIKCRKQFNQINAFNLHYYTKHNNGVAKQWENRTPEQRSAIGIKANKTIRQRRLTDPEFDKNLFNKRSKRMIANNPCNDSNVIEKIRKTAKKNFENKSKKEQDKIRQNWINAPKHNKNSKPTIFERALIGMSVPELAYTGNGKFWINIGTKQNGRPWNKNPDFKIRKQRKVIEVGDIKFWHTKDEIDNVVKHYQLKRFDCLYLTNEDFEDETWQDTQEKVLKFVYNHDVKVGKITKIRKFNTTKYQDKEKFRYNIEVEDNHNYFANDILVSNCHLLEKELMGQIEFLLSEYMFKRVGYPVSIPNYDALVEYQHWIEDNIGGIKLVLQHKTDDLKLLNRERVNLPKDSPQFLKLAGECAEVTSQLEEVDRLVRRMTKFLQTLDSVEWIFTIEKTEKLKMKRIVFRPLTVDKFAPETLLNYGQHRMYLSATILDKKSFCRSLGIDSDEAVFIKVPSTFPVENRRIYFTNTGYMNLANIDETLAKIATDVNKALDYHANEKGIIHCNSYKIAQYIERNCISPRLLFHDSSNRSNMLDKFMNSNDPIVLVSPSMTEGVDLKDDLARWEIIVKIPYLYLGDRQIARRMQVDPDWYVWQTCLTLVQSYGRIFRSENDWGTAYIFDSGARGFINKNRHILPDWFLEACS